MTGPDGALEAPRTLAKPQRQHRVARLLDLIRVAHALQPFAGGLLLEERQCHDLAHVAQLFLHAGDLRIDGRRGHQLTPDRDAEDEQCRGRRELQAVIHVGRPGPTAGRSVLRRLEGRVEARAHPGGIDALMRQVAELIPRLPEFLEFRGARRARREMPGHCVGRGGRQRAG